ncbi:MAG: nucleotidyltransferase domain-containing protein, partial [Rickettsiales bacterium]|nr:nucleotidyltransferase domain-containing protein [Rickettsiales bacterium]
MRRPFLEVAEDLFNRRFRKAKVMFAAGSLVRGEGTEKSDIDCHIIYADRDLPRAYRDTIIY